MLDLRYNGVVATMSPAPDRTEPRQRALRILIVEDQPDVADSQALLLSLEGHEIEVAPDGLTALEKARAREPDVVLLDIGLPGMDGYEVARRLQALPNGRRPFIIAVTGYGHEEQRNRSAEAGIDVHLLKPADPELLLRLLERLNKPFP
jgi:CheY-like chemotaxis protein